MAKILTKAGVTTGNTVEAFHVTQSIDAFTGIDAYDISLSGSFNMTGSINGEPGVTNPLTASYAITASYADNALSAINTPNAVITASNTGNDDTIEFLKGGGGAFSVTVNNVVSSSYALTASYALNGGGGSDTNFANTDLTFTGNRTHFLNNNYLFITDTFIPTSSFLYLDVVAQETQIGLGNSYLSFDSTTIDFIQSGSSRVEINSTETIINGGGGNYDFRVKGDTDNVLLYVDASTDRVAIGKNTPNAKLDVNGNTIITGSLTVSNSLNTEGAKVRKYRTITLTDADYSTAPSDKINADDDIILVINNTTSAPLVGEANFGISSFLASPSGRCVEIVCIKSGSYGISLSDPDMVGLRLWLNDQSQAGGYRQVCSDVGESITLMSYELDASGSAWGNGY
jgi:hypothetical protein